MEYPQVNISDKLSSEQRELMALIDAIMQLDTVLPQFNLSQEFLNLGSSVNAMQLLAMLMLKFVSVDKLIDLLTKILTHTLPATELAVKGVLLSNLKQLISCEVDPFIPSKYRQGLGEDPNNTEGIKIPISNIDPTNLLKIVPTTPMGQNRYMGTMITYRYKLPFRSIEIILPPSWSIGYDGTYLYANDYQTLVDYLRLLKNVNNTTPSSPSEMSDSIVYIPPTTNKGDKIKFADIESVGDISTIYELSRSMDMNAFLWFVLNKSHFKNADSTEKYTFPFNGNIINKEAIFPTEIKYPYFTGFVVKHNDYDVYGLCVNGERALLGSTTITTEVDGEIVVTASPEYRYQQVVYPFTNAENSANWYVDRSLYYKMIFPTNSNIKDVKNRDLNKAVPICNVALDNYTSNWMQEDVTIRVLPKPSIYKYFNYHSYEDKSEENKIFDASLTLFHTKLLFDEDGVPRNTKKPKIYTINWKNTSNTEDLAEENAQYHKYKIDEDNEIYLHISKKPNGLYWLEYPFEYDIKKNLHLCYPHLTIYEFNYDMVMSTKLFDAKVIAAQIIEAAMGGSLTPNDFLGNLSVNETMFQQRLAEVIRSVIEQDAFEISDCLYTFSNAEYTRMMEESENKRKNRYPFKNGEKEYVELDLTKVNDILKEYRTTASKEENEKVIKRAIEETVSCSIIDEILPEDKVSFSTDFLMRMLMSLVMSLVMSLITPKVLMIFEINKRMMGEGKDIPFTNWEELAKHLLTILIPIISEIRDMIMQELLNNVLKYIEELAEKVGKYITMEQISVYTELIKNIIKACTFGFPLFGHRTNLDSQLDVVQYADIKPIDKPQTSTC